MNTISRMDELQEIQSKITEIFCREKCTAYEAVLIIIQLTERIHKLTHGKDPYITCFGQNDNKVEPVIMKALEDDMVANSIHNIVNEILQDIGDILISEKLCEYECDIVLNALIEQIKK